MDPAPTVAQYPLRLSIDYPDRDLNRLTTFFRDHRGDPDHHRARLRVRRGLGK